MKVDPDAVPLVDVVDVTLTVPVDVPVDVVVAVEASEAVPEAVVVEPETAMDPDPVGLDTVRPAEADGLVVVVVPLLWYVFGAVVVSPWEVPASDSTTVAGLATGAPPVMVAAAAIPPLNVIAMNEASAFWEFNPIRPPSLGG